MSPRNFALAALALGLGACTSGVDPLPGFSTAYAPSGADGGAPLVLHSVRGSGAGLGWAVGDAGEALLLAGSSWTSIPTGSTAMLGGLSVLGSASAFAVELGGPRVLAWNGRVWSPVGADRANRAAAATWGDAPTDAWVAGDGVEHWDGQTWTQEVPSGAAFTSLFGSFRTDVWAVGPGGIQHYDGHAWSPVAAPAGAGALAGVWSSGLFDAWMVGAHGTVLHWDGSALTALASGTTKDLTSVAGSDPTDVWAGGQDGTLIHWDGTEWTTYMTPAGRTINDLWKAFDADVLLVDDTGTVTRYTP